MRQWSFGILIGFHASGARHKVKAQWIYGVRQTSKKPMWIIRNFYFTQRKARQGLWVKNILKCAPMNMCQHNTLKQELRCLCVSISMLPMKPLSLPKKASLSARLMIGKQIPSRKSSLKRLVKNIKAQLSA